MSKHGGLFDGLPEIQALGQQTLQRLCDEWTKTSVARECNVEWVQVSEQGSGVNMVDFSIRVDEKPPEGFGPQPPIELPFPALGLLTYVVKHGTAPELHSDLMERIKGRFARSPFVYRRYKTKPPQPMYYRCKDCKSILETQINLIPGQRLLGNFDPFPCPDCGSLQIPKAEDFGFLDDIRGKT